jgi:predicted ribonuclease YlaK
VTVFVVLDTSFWLDAKDPLGDFPYADLVNNPDFTLVVPFAVHEELDTKSKEGPKRQRQRARELLRDFRGILTTSKGDRLEGQTPRGLSIWLLPADDQQGGVVPDARIVQAARTLVEGGMTTVLLTRDGHMQLRAVTSKVPVQVVSYDLCETDDGEALEKTVSDLSRLKQVLQRPRA